MTSISSKAKRPADQQGATSSAKPVARFGNETVSAAVFKEQRTTKAGKPFTAFNVSLRRSYRKADGSFGYTHTLRGDDVRDAIEALKKCDSYIAAAEEGNVPGDEPEGA